MTPFREAKFAKDPDKENILETQRKDSLAQNPQWEGSMVGKGNGDGNGQTYMDIGGGWPPYAVKRSSMVFSNSAYAGLQGKSACETKTPLPGLHNFQRLSEL